MMRLQLSCGQGLVKKPYIYLAAFEVAFVCLFLNRLFISVRSVLYTGEIIVVRSENVSHQSRMVSEGKDQISDSDDFENDRCMKECKLVP